MFAITDNREVITITGPGYAESLRRDNNPIYELSLQFDRSEPIRRANPIPDLSPPFDTSFDRSESSIFKYDKIDLATLSIYGLVLVGLIMVLKKSK